MIYLKQILPLQIKDVKQLAESLNMTHDMPVNVLSIFGNTGDGKSHTLNHLFFGGKEVFATSSSQVLCKNFSCFCSILDQYFVILTLNFVFVQYYFLRACLVIKV